MSGNINTKVILDRICLQSKLERDRAELILIETIKTSKDYSIITAWIENKIKEKKVLEICLGCLTVFKVLLNHSTNLSSDYLRGLSTEFLEYHQNDEFRVRMLANECMGELCRVLGLAQFSEYVGHIKAKIIAGLVSHDNIIQENQDWKFLETWIKCLELVINGLGVQFEVAVDIELFDIILIAGDHPNRFVRESTYELIGTIAENRGYVKYPRFFIMAFKQLSQGLKDNWSQVRMPASVAARKLLLSVKPMGIEETEIFKIILPPLCLNRYYPAEGVRLYNQETWRIVVGNRGKDLIEGNIEETVKFYLEQCSASNHDVREAACSSISELALKLNPDVVRPFLSQLLNILEICLSDDIWSVRDVSCMACGRLVAAFPTDEKQYYKEVLMPLFIRNVTSSMYPVRESGAFSVAATVRTLSIDDIKDIEIILNFIIENLGNVKNQKAEHKTVKVIYKNSDLVHDTTQSNIMTSQKNNILVNENGSDSNFPLIYQEEVKVECKEGLIIKNSELWERADGCVMLIGELSLQVPQLHGHMSRLISSLIKALSYRHYSEHVYLLATASNTIVKLYEGLGKQQFKMHLNEFLEIIYVSLTSDCPITVTAAEDTIRFLGTKLGCNILRGRIEMYSLDLVDRTKHLI